MRKTKAKINIISSLFLQITIIVFGLIVPRVIIKNFGTGVNGLIESITQFLSYIVLLEAGAGGVVRAAFYKPLLNKNSDELSKIVSASNNFFRKLAVAFILFTLFLCLFYPFVINNKYDYFYTVFLIIIISISNFSQYYFGLTYQILIQSDQKKYFSDFIQIIAYVINTIGIVILIKFGCSIHFVKAFSVLVFSLKPIIYNVYAKKHYSIKYIKDSDSAIIKQRWDGLAHQIAAIIHNSTDAVILTIFKGVNYVSVYSIYSLIARGLRSIVLSITSGISATFGNMLANNEKDNVNNKFIKLEFIQSLLVFVIFTIALATIISFVKIYTSNIKDFNYIYPLFGYIIIISEGIYCLRDIYSMIIFAKGDFKQTKRGAYIESIINISISILLVKDFGLIGVSLGTLTAMLYRYIDYYAYVKKNIVCLDSLYIIKKNVINIICTVLSLLASKYLIMSFTISHFYEWILYANIIGIITICIFMTFYLLFYKKNLKHIMEELWKK